MYGTHRDLGKGGDSNWSVSSPLSTIGQLKSRHSRQMPIRAEYYEREVLRGEADPLTCMFRRMCGFTGSLHPLDAQKGFWAKLGNKAHDCPDFEGCEITQGMRVLCEKCI
jgi:hypothetical protein